MEAKRAAIRPISKFFRLLAIKIIGTTMKEPKNAGRYRIILSNEKGKS